MRCNLVRSWGDVLSLCEMVLAFVSCNGLINFHTAVFLLELKGKGLAKAVTTVVSVPVLSLVFSGSGQPLLSRMKSLQRDYPEWDGRR